MNEKKFTGTLQRQVFICEADFVDGELRALRPIAGLDYRAYETSAGTTYVVQGTVKKDG